MDEARDLHHDTLRRGTCAVPQPRSNMCSKSNLYRILCVLKLGGGLDSSPHRKSKKFWRVAMMTGVTNGQFAFHQLQQNCCSWMIDPLHPFPEIRKHHFLTGHSVLILRNSKDPNLGKCIRKKNIAAKIVDVNFKVQATAPYTKRSKSSAGVCQRSLLAVDVKHGSSHTQHPWPKASQ